MKSKALVNEKIIRKYQHRSWFLAMFLFIALIIILGHERQLSWERSIISPCQKNGCVVQVVYAKDEQPELVGVIDYITTKFMPEGKDVVVKAINCFYSESGLRPLAYGFNNWNKTADVGVAQINDVHGMSIQERQDYKKNIDKAYELYKSAGKSFSPWYGPLCK